MAVGRKTKQSTCDDDDDDNTLTHHGGAVAGANDLRSLFQYLQRERAA